MINLIPYEDKVPKYGPRNWLKSYYLFIIPTEYLLPRFEEWGVIQKIQKGKKQKSMSNGFITCHCESTCSFTRCMKKEYIDAPIYTGWQDMAKRFSSRKAALDWEYDHIYGVTHQIATGLIIRGSVLEKTIEKYHDYVTMVNIMETEPWDCKTVFDFVSYERPNEDA